ncbi:MAG: group 1 glycosyl transferase [Burkholderiaceae bacterium]|nr:group 1 glycosyl transferase [Burkholderiaceae bacterium]
MNIAIVAPSPVPFVIGGAENLWAGMLAAFNAQPGIQADLIKLPSPERTFPEVLASYRRFAQLDLNHFDLVISTKYPAWAIRHPHHRVYLQHKLRGLYDTYPPNLSTRLSAGLLKQAGLPANIGDALQGAALAGLEIPAVVDALLDAHTKTSGNHELWAFPGPFSRACVHLLDRIALQPGRIERYAAISNTVAQRKDYFPEGVTVDAFHHPTQLQNLHCGQAGAIFSASRLDRPKRIDLIIEGYLQSGVDRPLKIAGSGPDEDRLRQMAKSNPNIHFLGRLTDAQLVEEYANAFCVPFVPHEEDYGLITVEAMQSSKAVLTASDSGGSTELVEHRKNGLIVEPTPKAIAEGLRALCADPDATRVMGEAGKQRMASITWQGLVERLLADAQPSASTPASARATRPAKPRLTVVNTFPIMPVVSGGQLRLYGLYRHIASMIDVHFVNLGSSNMLRQTRQIAPGLTEECIPKSRAFAKMEGKLQQQLNASVGDLAAALHPSLLNDWIAAISRSAAQSQAVICSHPYGHAALEMAGYGCPMIYEAHNVEFDVKQSIVGHDPAAIAHVRQIEADCIRAASAMTACSADDLARFRELYDLCQRRTAVIENGVDTEAVAFTPLDQRRQLQSRLMVRRPTALFMGSAHQPNIDAARTIIDAARAMPEVDFVLMGSVCQSFRNQSLTSNVCLLGIVSAAEKQMWLSVADIGLNPMLSGSGTNLKIVEYAAAGIPIVSSVFGARGGILSADEDYIETDENSLKTAIGAMLATTEARKAAMTTRNREQVRLAADWKAIAGRYSAFLEI